MLLRIRVKPNSRTDEIIRDADGGLIVKIKAPPVDGKANKYLVEFLAAWLDIPKSRVKLLKGETSAHKILEIDADEADVMAKLPAVSDS